MSLLRTAVKPAERRTGEIGGFNSTPEESLSSTYTAGIPKLISRSINCSVKTVFFEMRILPSESKTSEPRSIPGNARSICKYLMNKVYQNKMRKASKNYVTIKKDFNSVITMIYEGKKDEESDKKKENQTNAAQ